MLKPEFVRRAMEALRSLTPLGREFVERVYDKGALIDVSHVSGISNVRSWLDAHGYDGNDEVLCRYILDAAKKALKSLGAN